MTNKKLNPASQMRRSFIQASGMAAVAPLIPNFALAQSASKSALATSSKGMVTSPHELATEAGLKGFDAQQWYGVVGPSNMPAAIVKVLNDAMLNVLSQPDFKDKLSSEAVELMPMKPAAAAAPAALSYAAQRLGKLQAKLQSTTDEGERERIREQILLEQGKDKPMPAPKWIPVPGGQSIDPATQQVIRDPSGAFNPQTGEYMQLGQAAKPPARAVGSISTRDGKSARWDGTKWIPL